MARMDERLPLTQGTNRIIEDPVPVSGVRTAVDFATQTLGGYVQLREDMSREAARRKKADAEAREAQIALEVSQSPERAAASVAGARSEFLKSIEPTTPSVEETGSLVSEDAAFQFGQSVIDENGVFSQLQEVSPVLRREVNVAAQRAANFKAAEEQGRVPSITFNAAMNADFRRLRDKYPDQVAYIIKMYKEMGIDANLFTEAKDAQDSHEFEREMGQKRVTAEEERNEVYIKSAQEAYGAETLTWNRERQIVEGMRVTQQAFELKQTGERYRLLKEQRDLNETERKSREEELNKEFERKLVTGSFNSSQPFIQSMGRLVDGLNTDPNNPELVQRFQALAPEAKMGVERYISSALAAASQEGYTGDLGELEKTLRQQWQPILDIFAGDFSVVSNKMSALRSIETSMKIDTATALPLYTALSGAGFDVKNIPAIMKGMETDTELMTALSNELKGYRQDLLADGGSARFRRIIDILRGEDTLSRAKPGALVKELPSLVNSTKQLAKEYIRKPQDIDGNLVLNGVGEITTQLRGLPTNNTTILAQATLSFATPEHRRALVQASTDKNLDNTVTLATIQASRAGSAVLLNYFDKNVVEINKNSPFFKVVWDREDGKYKLDRSGLRAAVRNIQTTERTYLAGGVVERKLSSEEIASRRQAALATQPPAEMTRFIKAANINLDNAIELGRIDPSTPEGTDVQLRNWYGKQIPLPRKKGEEINPEQELERMFSNAEGAIDQLRDSTGRVKVREREDFTRAPGFAQYGDVVRKAASDYNIPESIAIALVGKESTFTPGKKGPVIESGTHKGDRAIGLGQVMAKTAAKYGVTDRESLTPEQEADLSMRILKDNYNRYGNWRDAVSAYFTGVDYAKAVKQGRSDGFSSVIDYVEDIL